MKTQMKPETVVDYFGLTYPMMLYPEVEGGYRVVIMDLPGCLSRGACGEYSWCKGGLARIAWKCGDSIPRRVNFKPVTSMAKVNIDDCD